MASVKRKRESSPSPSSSSTRLPKYGVFLSFRGEDTRINFTDHLYNALKQKGIKTFRDEEELKKGERISELFKAIEESQFAIIVLSKKYASSTWCLDELVKIIKCEDETGLKVLPVFYDVSPSIVRKQTGTFKKAFTNHQKRFEDNIEKVETWRDTLKKVADIKGWNLHLQNRHEFEIIQDIVKVIMEKLRSKSSEIDKNLIGVKSMVAELIPSYLGFGNEIYMMGICGMGGLGKTTLASAIYGKYLDQFESSSFIANVRERSEKGELHKLQQQLLKEILEEQNRKIYNVQEGDIEIKRSGLCKKKVLLVLDDVNHKDQLEKLAGEPHNWFGSGSWIIITARDEHVLVDHGVPKIYKPNGLNDDDASKLFCLKAFKNMQPKEDYMQLSKEVVGYASGLPLALVTLGSSLAGFNIDDWKSALEDLKKNLDRDIFNILKISYDGLKEMEKKIFLDIACCFRWRQKDEVIEILKSCGINARYGISVLVKKSLLTIDHDEWLTMHDLLQEMGKKIDCQESGGNLEKQSRLWLNEDLLDVLKNKKATEAIQAISFCFRGREKDFNLGDFSEGFSKMSNLRLLVISGIDLSYDERHLALPNNLRSLRWRGCPFKCLASSHKQQMEFVYLDLQRSNFKYLWEGVMAIFFFFLNPFKCLASSHKQQMEFVYLDLQCSKFKYLWEGVMLADKLKFIDLSCSQNLIRTPDFSGVPMLEVLDLYSCSQLVEIHESIGKLQKLRRLNLYWCASLTSLPSMSETMRSLTILNLSRCYNISSFPKFTGIMKSLSELNLSSTAIKEVKPSSIKYLTALTFLDLSHCTSLECLPSNMDTLKSLETLKFSQCPKLKSLPRFPSNVRYLETGGFFSLNWSPEGVKLSIWSHPLSQWLPFDESGSLEGFTVLLHVLRGLLFRKAVLGGYIIWSCSAEKEGSSVNIKLPSNWKKSEWIGFALWASLRPDGEEVRAHVIAPDDMLWNHHDYMLWNHHASEHSTTYIDGICLLYLSREVWIATVGDGECSQIKVKFSNSRCSALHIRGACGVSLIYKQDEVRVDELNETNAPYFIESTEEEVSIYKLTAGDEDVRTVGEVVHKFGYDDFDDTDI